MRVSIFKMVGIISFFLTICSSISANNIHTSPLTVELLTNDIPIANFRNDNDVNGFIVDYTNAILQELNDSCVFRVLNREISESDFNEKSLFLINSLYPNNDTLKSSVPLITFGYDVVGRKGTTYTQPSDLLNKKIILTANSGALPILEQMGVAYTEHLNIVPNMEVGFKMLAGGEADYAIANHLQVKNLMQQDKFSDLAVYDSGFDVQSLYLASINPYLVSDINAAINRVNRNGAFNELYLKWYGQTKNVYITYVWILVGVICFILILIGVMLKVFKTIISKAKARILKSNERARYQYQFIDMLKHDDDVNLYQYDVFNNELFVLEDNQWCEHTKSLNEIENQISSDDRGKYDRCFDDLINGTKNDVTCTLRIFKKETGRYNNYEFNVTTQKDKDDVVCKLLIIQRKLSKVKVALSTETPQLDEAAFELELAIRASKLILWKYDVEANEYHVACEKEKSHMLTAEEWFSCIEPNDVEVYQQYLDNKIAGNNDSEFCTIRIKLYDSEHYAPYEVYAVPRTNGEGVVYAVQGTISNVSKLIDKQSQLNERTEVLESIYKNMPVGMILYSSEGQVRKINDYLLNLFSLSSDNEEIYSYNLFGDENINDNVKRRLLSGEVIHREMKYDELPDQAKKGTSNTTNRCSIFDLSLYAVLNETKEIIGYVMMLVDKTNWYQSLSRIDELKNNIGWALDVSGLKAWIYDHQIESLKLLKTKETEEQVISKEDFIQNTHPDDTQILWDAIESIHNGTHTTATVKYRYMLDGKWRWFQSSLTAPYLNDENSYITGIYKDITEEVEAQQILDRKHQDLQDSEEKLSLILNKLPIPVYAIEPETDDIKYINDAAIRLFGEKRYKHVVDFLHEDDIELHNKINREVVNSNKEYIANETLRLSDGTEFYTHVRKLLFEYNGIKQALVIRLDQTAQRKAEVINKIISTSLPALKAFTWYKDSRSDVINYSSPQTSKGKDLSLYNTMDKVVSVIHEEDWSNYHKSILKLMEQDAGESSLHFRMNLEGEYEWWENRVILETMYDENNEPYKLLYGIIINIDKQKNNELHLEQGKVALANLNKQNELILNNTSSGLVYLNTDYEVQWSNIGLVFGADKNHLYQSGQKCYQSFHQDCVCEHCPVVQAIEQNNICQYDFKVDNCVYGTTAIPVFNGDAIEGIVLRIDNITERVNLINDLKEAKNKAEESDKLKMAFLANMSHEIRTPLNAIVGFSEMVQYANTPAERDEYISIINSNNELLLRLIGDVLDLSKIESGSIDIYKEETDVVALFNDIFTSLRSRCTNPLIEMSFQNNMESCVTIIDKNRLAQITNNFLSNAIKYTSEGKIILKLDYVNGGLKMSVEDTGIGIDESKHHLIFCRFEKLDSFARGTGLGLAICKAIVDDLKGEIGFDSALDSGSTFWAWIPCEAVVANSETKAIPKKKRRVSKRKTQTQNLQLGLFFQEDTDQQDSNVLWN